MPDGTSNRDETPIRVPPHNEEAEQALLGAILVNNRAYEKVIDFLRPEHFFDPAHARIYRDCQILIDRGHTANPVTLKDLAAQNAELTEIGGASYLARLAASVVTVHNAEDYGRAIHDAYLRRQLIEVGENLAAEAYRADVETTPSDLLRTAESTLFGLAETGDTVRKVVHIADAGLRALQRSEAGYKAGGRITGLTTGLDDLDEILGGLQPEMLYLLAARPSMGKTALGANTIPMAVTREEEKPVGILELEMSAEQLAQRQMAAITAIGTEDQQRGKLTPQQFDLLIEARTQLCDLPIFVDDSTAVTVAQLRLKARRMVRQQKIKLLVVDHLGLMEGSREVRRNGNQVAVISEISRGLKNLAKELKIPVLALSQLSRDVEKREDKRPTLADLRDSGSLEQDADCVIFIYREEYYLSRAEPQQRADEEAEKFSARLERWHRRLDQVANTADIIVAKNRMGGIGVARVHWNGNRQLFSNLAHS